MSWLLACSVLRTHRVVADHHFISAEPLIIECDLSTVTGPYVPVADFYVRNHKGMPSAPPDNIVVNGLVEREARLRSEDLGRCTMHKVNAVLECAGNTPGAGGVSNGRWEGVAFGEILRSVKPLSSAHYVNLYGADGYSRSVPIEDVKEYGLIATRLDGLPLSLVHGSPWRVFLPGWYGMDSVKWINRIELASAPLPSNADEYTQLIQRAGTEPVKVPLPRVQVRSVIISPAPNSVLRAGTVEIRGLAWSGMGAISKVEVSIDGSLTWSEVRLEHSNSDPYDWVLWRRTADLSRRGRIELVCRATDSAGNTQPAHRDPQRLDGYGDNVYHHVPCVVA